MTGNEQGLVPACAKACPTAVDPIRRNRGVKASGKAARRAVASNADTATRKSITRKQTSVGGTHAMFVILGEPEAYNFPPAPEVPTVHLKSAWTAALVTALVVVLVVCVAFAL